MAQPHNSYFALAAQALADAEAATLDNVRERCLRSASAWSAMAERQQRVDAARAAREAPRTVPDEPAALLRSADAA